MIKDTPLKKQFEMNLKDLKEGKAKKYTPGCFSKK